MRVLLDTNILISAVLFGGKPRTILKLVLSGKVIAITSEVLIRELIEVLRLKFNVQNEVLLMLENLIRQSFILVSSTEAIEILQDEPDNRVLEAAQEGKCDFIVTGDKEFLSLGKFRGIRIIDTANFLDLH
ncbi:MAG: putative toxin-antitoxin system toxin component, PIN family [Candidatus Berkelbacteria bacterium]|nr:putative toxin-antitoxin system toxin component, PIN family [Candidatus Berkelbacteria bacterium]